MGVNGSLRLAGASRSVNKERRILWTRGHRTQVKHIRRVIFSNQRVQTLVDNTHRAMDVPHHLLNQRTILLADVNYVRIAVIKCIRQLGDASTNIQGDGNETAIHHPEKQLRSKQAVVKQERDLVARL